MADQKRMADRLYGASYAPKAEAKDLWERAWDAWWSGDEQAKAKVLREHVRTYGPISIGGGVMIDYPAEPARTADKLYGKRS